MGFTTTFHEAGVLGSVVSTRARDGTTHSSPPLLGSAKVIMIPREVAASFFTMLLSDPVVLPLNHNIKYIILYS